MNSSQPGYNLKKAKETFPKRSSRSSDQFKSIQNLSKKSGMKRSIKQQQKKSGQQQNQIQQRNVNYGYDNNDGGGGGDDDDDDDDDDDANNNNGSGGWASQDGNRRGNRRKNRKHRTQTPQQQIQRFFQNNVATRSKKTNLLKKKLQKTFFSINAIQKKQNQLLQIIKYFPDVNLANTLSRYGYDLNDLIFQTMTFRTNTLRVNASIDKTLDEKVQYIYNNIIPWGYIPIDINKLQANSLLKTNNSNNKQFTIQQLNLKLVVYSNRIQGFFKNKQISPSKFVQTQLKKLATDQLKKQAQQIYQKYMSTL